MKRRAGIADEAYVVVGFEAGQHLGAVDRGAQPAEFVDQAALQCVGAGPHPAAGDRVDGLDGQLAALGDPLDEVGVEQVGLRLDMRALLVGERLVDRPCVGVGVSAHRVGAHAEAVLELAGHQLAGDDADRAGDRSGVGHDRVSGHRHVVAARRRDRAHRRDDGLTAVADPIHLAPNGFRPGDRSAGTVDAQHDRGDVVVGRRPRAAPRRWCRRRRSSCRTAALAARPAR